MMKTLKQPKLKLASRKTSFFNLIEVLMALIVIAIGVVGIMGLVPLGFSAARDARIENYATFGSGEFMMWITAEATKLNSDNLVNGLADSNWDNVVGQMETTKPDPDGAIEGWDISSNGAQEGDSNIYRLEALKLYRIVQGNTTYPDFIASVRLWKEFVAIGCYNPSLAGPNYFDKREIPDYILARLKVELSWPSSKPYAKRDKRTFSLDLYNPN